MLPIKLDSTYKITHIKETNFSMGGCRVVGGDKCKFYIFVTSPKTFIEKAEIF